MKLTSSSPFQDHDGMTLFRSIYQSDQVGQYHRAHCLEEITVYLCRDGRSKVVFGFPEELTLLIDATIVTIR